MSINLEKNDTITDGPRFLRLVRARFAALAPGDHSFSLPIGDIRVHFRARIVAQPKKLLFTFHGSVNRESSKKPPFNSFFPGLDDTHQVAISDPTLTRSKDIRVAWFAGHAEFDTQFHLRGALRTIAKALQIERTIYFGNSAGGFAALYYAYFAPRSIALVFNPQTSILAYHNSHVNVYRSTCWPALTDNDQLPSVMCTDVAQLYSQGFRNTVIYCQSMGDWHHTSRHMLPFAGAMAGQTQARRFLLYSDYKGLEGHVSDYESYRDWASTVASSPGDDPKDLLNIWHVISNRPKQGQASLVPASPTLPAPADVRAAAKPGFRPEDLATATRLRAFQESRR